MKIFVCVAVQEERQRGREKSDNEVESSSSSFNEEMPVEKILDAELAVEPKTEAYMESSTGNSVRHLMKSFRTQRDVPLNSISFLHFNIMEFYSNILKIL